MRKTVPQRFSVPAFIDSGRLRVVKSGKRRKTRVTPRNTAHTQETLIIKHAVHGLKALGLKEINKHAVK